MARGCAGDRRFRNPAKTGRRREMVARKNGGTRAGCPSFESCEGRRTAHNHPEMGNDKETYSQDRPA